ncbi:AbrB/MazE/SpoVT family DNA-binding domain-containing protein [Levilactobacillus enshiensis]|uniref:AbrB/MazE/SpoVT family DNA-binding domain-containing protein n=1 Tax=Levilactobacillus enshiensis TaxID=2590213 RepID=UPI001179D8A3|nr:AbrB/MazE/SpoVT family DNA-binding domain-containing protein [Levilactobacillus enshiensis]
MKKPEQIPTTKTYEVKLSNKGQMVIPAEIRKQADLKTGDTLQVTLNENNEIVLQKIPTAADWANLVAEGPVEDVVFKADGTVDETKSPNFVAWMNEDK